MPFLALQANSETGLHRDNRSSVFCTEFCSLYLSLLRNSQTQKDRVVRFVIWSYLSMDCSKMFRYSGNGNEHANLLPWTLNGRRMFSSAWTRQCVLVGQTDRSPAKANYASLMDSDLERKEQKYFNKSLCRSTEANPHSFIPIRFVFVRYSPSPIKST